MFTAVTLLPVMRVFRIVAIGCGRMNWSMLRPPASPACSSKSIDPVYETVLSLMTLSATSSAPLLPMPPESAWFAIAPSTTTWLPLTALLRTTSELAKWFEMPPADASLAMEAREVVEPAMLFVTWVFVSVKTPPLSIPPPLLNAHARGPQKPGGITSVAVVVLPVMTLFEIETVAPATLNGGWSICATGISTPPPNVTSGFGNVVLRPPVIVTRSIDTTKPSEAVAR